MATTLLMIGPSREFAAGVAALLVSAVPQPRRWWTLSNPAGLSGRR